MTYCFIPGGPWISGDYWDDFLKTFPEKSRRIVLLNHESRYGKDPGRSYADVIADCRAQVRDLNENVVLVGHSFGAWVAAELLDESNVLRAELISMPTSFKKEAEIERKIQSIPYADFGSFWKKIREFYHFRPITLSYETYWKGNENLMPSQAELDNVLESLRKAQKSWGLIYGDRDIVVKYPGPFREIRNCGHFPMNEGPEEFARLIRNPL